MSKVNLQTKKDITTFFKILAEESVKDAKSRMIDPKAVALDKQKDEDEEAYKKIIEQPEEEEFSLADIPPEGDAPDEAPPADIDVDVDIPSPPSAMETSPEEVSLDSIADKIKRMRSGRSIDDTSVHNPLRSYFDYLSNAERLALYAFVDALAKIMTGDPDQAPDPSDPPWNVTMTTGEEEVEVAEEEIEVEAGADEGGEVEEEETEEEAPVPIKAGAPQEREAIAEIRLKVLELLGKS